MDEMAARATHTSKSTAASSSKSGTVDEGFAQAATMLFQQIFFITTALAKVAEGTNAHTEQQRMRDEAQDEAWELIRCLRDNYKVSLADIPRL